MLCRHVEVAYPPSRPPQSTRVAPSPITGGLGTGLGGAQHHCDGAYRPEAGGRQVRRALPAARAILPATWKGLAAQLSSPHVPPSPFPSPPGTHLPAVFRERGWGPGWSQARGWEGRRAVGMVMAAPVKTEPKRVEQWGGHPPTSSHGTRWGAAPCRGDMATLPSPTCPAAPWPPVSSSTTREGKTPMRPSKSPVQKPSSTSPGARGSTRMMAPSGKLSSSGLCPS